MTSSEWGVRIRGGLKLTMVEVGQLLADLAWTEQAYLVARKELEECLTRVRR